MDPHFGLNVGQQFETGTECVHVDELVKCSCLLLLDVAAEMEVLW